MFSLHKSEPFWNELKYDSDKQNSNKEVRKRESERGVYIEGGEIVSYIELLIAIMNVSEFVVCVFEVS